MSSSPTRLERLWGRRGSRTVVDVAKDVSRGVPARAQEVLDVWNALCHYVEVLMSGGRGVAVTCRGHTLCIFKLSYSAHSNPRAGVAARDGMSYGSSTPAFKLDARFEERYSLHRSPLTPSQCPMVTLSTTPIAEELRMPHEHVRSLVADIITSVGEGLFNNQCYDLDWGFCKVHLSKKQSLEALFGHGFLEDLKAFDERRESRERKHEFMIAAAAGVHVGGSQASGSTPREVYPSPLVEKHRLFSPGWQGARSNVDLDSPAAGSQPRPSSPAPSSSARPPPRSHSASSQGRGAGRPPSRSNTPQRSATPTRAFCPTGASGQTFSRIAHEAAKRRTLLQVVPQSKDPSAALHSLLATRPQSAGGARRKPRSAAAEQRLKMLDATRPTAAVERKVAWQGMGERDAVEALVEGVRDSEGMDTEVIQEGSLFAGSPCVQVRKMSGSAAASDAIASPAASAAPAAPVVQQQQQRHEVAEELGVEARPSTAPAAAVREPGASAAACGGGGGFLHFSDDTSRVRQARDAAREVARFNRSMSSSRKEREAQQRVAQHSQENATVSAAEEAAVQKQEQERAERMRQQDQLRKTWSNQMSAQQGQSRVRYF